MSETYPTDVDPIAWVTSLSDPVADDIADPEFDDMFEGADDAGPVAS